MFADPGRYRQSLLDSLTDDGLEELTLRLAEPDYPNAYRTGRGSDGGIDVLSDLELPPARAWQCKNCKPDWSDCRESLRRAMSDDNPPPHYTFVFPRPLTKNQLKWWRAKFVPQQRKLYPELETLDLWDNIADRLGDRPDLINALNEGVLAASYSAVAKAASLTGVNPLASIPDLIGDAPELARRAVEAGRTDPRYRYENRQREARPEDRTIPEDRIRFSFEATLARQRSFTATIRAGDAVQEKAAEPREDVPLEQVTLWFADTDAGAAQRLRVRTELAAGRAMELKCDADVGVDAHPLPDRFASLADADGILRAGEAHVGLSDPLRLEVTMDGREGATPTAPFPMYRIPSEPGADVSYGGTFHGALLFLDVGTHAQRSGEPRNWSEASIACAIDPADLPATELVTGLGFVLAFAHADRLRLVCDGLLPLGGLELDITEHGINGESAAILENAITVTAVLAELTRLDRRPRALSPTGSQYELAIAETVAELLRYREIRQPLTQPYRYAIPGATHNGDPSELMRGVRRPLARLADQPTIVVELRIEGDADGRLLNINGATVLEATPHKGGRAEVVMTLVGPVPHGVDDTGAAPPS
jgi:hypothetical protein